MDTKELLKKVRKIEIKTKRLSDHIFGGEYQSTFKGRGMAFSEVRQYQFGDDVRAIDWNVTARYNDTLVTSPAFQLTPEHFRESVKLSAGKKRHVLLKLDND